MLPLEASAALLQTGFISPALPHLCQYSAPTTQKSYFLLLHCGLRCARPLRFPRPTKTSCIFSFLRFCVLKRGGVSLGGFGRSIFELEIRPFCLSFLRVSLMVLLKGFIHMHCWGVFFDLLLSCAVVSGENSTQIMKVCFFFSFSTSYHYSSFHLPTKSTSEREKLCGQKKFGCDLGDVYEGYLWSDEEASMYFLWAGWDGLFPSSLHTTQKFDHAFFFPIFSIIKKAERGFRAAMKEGIYMGVGEK